MLSSKYSQEFAFACTVVQSGLCPFLKVRFIYQIINKELVYRSRFMLAKLSKASKGSFYLIIAGWNFIANLIMACPPRPCIKIKIN
jgi:hypothetical protein